MGPTSYALMITFRVWLVEIPVAAFNAFVLMDRVYAPRVGAVRAHRLAMSTRIGWIVALGFAIAHFAAPHPASALLAAGLFWMGLWLLFEWAGSLLIRRPVHEILIGWHLERGYMWPYVLLAYALSPLLAGAVLDLATR